MRTFGALMLLALAGAFRTHGPKGEVSKAAASVQAKPDQLEPIVKPREDKTAHVEEESKSDQPQDVVEQIQERKPAQHPRGIVVLQKVPGKKYPQKWRRSQSLLRPGRRQHRSPHPSSVVDDFSESDMRLLGGEEKPASNVVDDFSELDEFDGVSSDGALSVQETPRSRAPGLLAEDSRVEIEFDTPGEAPVEQAPLHEQKAELKESIKQALDTRSATKQDQHAEHVTTVVPLEVDSSCIPFWAWKAVPRSKCKKNLQITENADVRNKNKKTEEQLKERCEKRQGTLESKALNWTLLGPNWTDSNKKTKSSGEYWICVCPDLVKLQVVPKNDDAIQGATTPVEPEISRRSKKQLKTLTWAGDKRVHTFQKAPSIYLESAHKHKENLPIHPLVKREESRNLETDLKVLDKAISDANSLKKQHLDLETLKQTLQQAHQNIMDLNLDEAGADEQDLLKKRKDLTERKEEAQNRMNDVAGYSSLEELLAELHKKRDEVESLLEKDHMKASPKDSKFPKEWTAKKFEGFPYPEDAFSMRRYWGFNQGL